MKVELLSHEEACVFLQDMKVESVTDSGDALLYVGTHPEQGVIMLCLSAILGSSFYVTS